MGFWIFMLVMVVLIPLVMIIFGAIFLNRSPKKINFFFGYRTALSMKNKDTWDYAHKLVGKIWLILGAITLIISIIPMLFVIGKDDNLIGILGTLLVMGELVPLFISIIPVEIGLNRKFDKNGNIKEPKD